MLAPEEEEEAVEEAAALEWDVSAAIVHLAAVDQDTALLCGLTTDSLWRTSLHGLAGRT